MSVIDLINAEKSTAFSFEILPPLKGTGIDKLQPIILLSGNTSPLSSLFKLREERLLL